MKEALHAEWTKLRTLASTKWLLLGSLALTVGVGAAVAGAASYDSAPAQDTTKTALTGIQAGQAVIVILAVLAVTNEYSTGMIRVTFTAMPRRLEVLSAKATLVAGLSLLAGTMGVAASLLIARIVLDTHGFTAAHGYPPLSLTHAATLRAAAGSVLYLALIALLSLGAATAVRDTATAIGMILGVLYLFPILAQAISDPHWQRHLDQISPMKAGLSIQNTLTLHNLVISPWTGLGVLAAWAAAALAIGGLFLTPTRRLIELPDRSPRDMEATIGVSGPRQRFGPAQEVDDVSFLVVPGQVIGFVEPNRASKSGHDAHAPGSRHSRRHRFAPRAGLPAVASPAQPPGVPTRPPGGESRPQRSPMPTWSPWWSARETLFYAGHAPAPLSRRRVGRPGDPDLRRAVQRHGPRVHCVDARLLSPWPPRVGRFRGARAGPPSPCRGWPLSGSLRCSPGLPCPSQRSRPSRRP